MAQSPRAPRQGCDDATAEYSDWPDGVADCGGAVSEMVFAGWIERAINAFRRGEFSGAQCARFGDSKRRARSKESHRGFGRSAARRTGALCGPLRGVPRKRRKRRHDDGPRHVSKATKSLFRGNAKAFGRRTLLDYREWSAIYGN